jgi:hypothetical protein
MTVQKTARLARVSPALALVLAGTLAVSSQANAQTRTPSSFPLVVDRDMTPTAGSLDLLTIQRLLTIVEERVLPPVRFDESTPVRHALGIGYRLGTFVLLDVPQDHFLMVVAHEVFGHGARLREAGASGIHYGFDAPFPYGRGGAVTEFGGDIDLTRADRLGIDAAGIEAQSVLAGLVGERSIARGAIGYREAWMYLESRLDGLRYIRSVSPQSAPGHDVRDFLDDFNDGCNPPACAPLDEVTLKRRAFLMLADPLLAYAAYGVAVSYVVRGHAASAVPMIPLPHELQYLPALRFEMTPYGTAWTIDHMFVRDGQTATLSTGFGDTGRGTAWNLGIRTTEIVRQQRIGGDLMAEIWRQPRLDLPPTSPALTLGGLAAATARVALGCCASNRVGLYLQGGYKSEGFVRGERLRAGPIVRVGLTLAL